MFREVASGAKTDRAQLRKAIAALEAGDVLMVTRLDRLARSTRDLLNTLAAITGKAAGFRSLGNAWPTPRLRSCSPCSAAWRNSSTSEGRECAKARGVQMGRPHKLTPHQQREAPGAGDHDGETLATSPAATT
jgi:hypothetical protein